MIRWLIQSNAEDVDVDPIIAEVSAQGMRVLKVDNGHWVDRDLCQLNREDVVGLYGPPTVCYGEIDFVRQVQRCTMFIPGAWCNFENMRCSTYYAYFGEHLLNQQYIMLPIGDLLRRWDQLAANTTGNSWFIRPDSGAKPFTGYVVKPGEKHKIKSLVQAVGPRTLVVVAPEKSITAEWRFVICDKKVIAGCQYLPTESPSYPTSSFRLASLISSQEWQPDLCYTVDIAESNGKMYLLEINSFSCASFYGCDISSIVKHASRVARDEWAECNS